MPIPGGPTTVTRFGRRSRTVRSNRMRRSPTSASRPTNGVSSAAAAPTDGPPSPSTRHRRIGRSIPLTVSSPRSVNAKAVRVSRWVRSPTTTRPGSARAWSRAATFTASPVTMPSSEPWAITSPVLTPMRMESSPPARAASCALRAARRRCIASAHRMARTGSSSCATGAPNAATTASPMNFSTVPPNRSISSAIASKKGRSTARRSSGSRRAAISVEAVRSAKSMVTTLRSSTCTRTAADGSRGEPQLPQKRLPGRFSVPQAAHIRTRDVPQAPQKRFAAGLAAPQLGHAMSVTPAPPPTAIRRGSAGGHPCWRSRC